MRKLLCYMKGYRKECVLGPFLKLLEALLELLVPYVILHMIDQGIMKGDGWYIVRSVLLLVLMGFVGLGFSLAAQYFSAKAAVGFTSRVREALFAHIQHLDYQEIDTLGRSTLITRLTSDMNQVQTGVNLTLRLFLRSPFIVFGAAIMAFTIDFDAAMVFVIAIPVLAVIVFSIMLIGIPLYKKVQARLDKILGRTKENLSGVRMLRALCKEEAETEAFAIDNEALSRSQKFVGRISSLMNPLTYVIINLAICLVIYRGGVKVNDGLLTQAAVLALYNYMSQILVELIKLANLIISITKAVACANRVQAVLETEPKLRTGTEVKPGKSDLAVSFDRVSFRYTKGGANALSDISFAARNGESIGVIGGTGSGKSTLIHLLCHFYDVTEGEVRVRGRAVSEYAQDSLLAQIAIVPQKATLFAGTIRTNLSYGKIDATDEDMWEALRLAEAESFVRKLPEGLDAPVEQFGRNFSGGQRQRLTIARALIRRAPILILDDSTSALDYATDLALRRNLRSLEDVPTVFMISQRASTLHGMDQILVLEEGELVGCGRHEDLYQSCPVYREICDSQARNA